MAVFAAKIAGSPALAREVARVRADKLLLKKVYGPLAEQPIPDRLRAALRPRRAASRFVQFTAAAALAAGLALAMWFGPGLIGGDAVVREALSARQGKETAVASVAIDGVPAAERDALVETALSVPVKVPDLGRSGFALTAITLYRQAAQLSYRDTAGRLFTVYLRRSLGPDRFDIHEDGKTEICVWQNAELAVAMVGEMTAKEMLKVASMSYADLNL
jgi:anti-sigma factor RsiW